MTEFDSKYYDKIYQDGGNFQNYNKHYSKSSYFNLWKEIIHWIEPGIIMDFGCGPGQFAHALSDLGKDDIYYTGIDFSKEAIDMAKAKKLPNRFIFYQYDMEWWVKRRLLQNFHTYMALETLEHLEIELEFRFIKAIPAGKTVIITLPDFQAKGHLRVYPDQDYIRLRYHQLFSFQEMITEVVNTDTGAKITAFKAIKL